MMYRLIGTPKRASYLILALAVALAIEGVWIVNLSGRVSNAEEIRRAEQRGAAARKNLGCQFVAALVDVSIAIPLKNIDDVLAGTTLTPKERADRIAAKARYMDARGRIEGVVRGCVK